MNQTIHKLMVEVGYAAPEIEVRAQALVQAVARECCADILLCGYNEGEKPVTPEMLVRLLKSKFGIE